MPQPNNFLTDDVIAKESLRLLKNNLVAANLVYRDYEKTFGKVGDTISIKKPYRAKVADGRVLVKQPMVDETIPFEIDRQHNFGLEYVMKDKTLDIQQFSDRYLKTGMIQMANKIDRNILMTLKKAYHTSGAAGTRPSKFIHFAEASAKMSTYAVPMDMRRAVLDPFTIAGLSDEVTKLFNPQMVNNTFKSCYKGDVAEFSTFDSQNLPKHLVGNYGGTPLVQGTQTNGDIIRFDGGTASINGFLKEGDVITIAGVYGVNPQNYETTGMLQEFVVLQDVDTSGTGVGQIRVSPSMNDGNATKTNADGETISLRAYQNITNLPADNARINVVGVANTTYEQNYLFHRDAIALCMVELELPQSATIKSRASDPETGLSLSLTGAFDINEHSETRRIDAVYGVHMIYPDLAMRLYGNGTI